MKEILSNKRNLEELGTLALRDEREITLPNIAPQKQKDPGSFSIPCAINDCILDRTLCDLGASVNVMPYSTYEKLGLSELKPTLISLQLADRSIKQPRGVIENINIKVRNFEIPADFIVLDMEGEHEFSLIFGRPFLATTRAIIDVYEGEITLRVSDKKMKFEMLKKNVEENVTYRPVEPG